MALTFLQLKTEVLLRIRRRGICDDFHNVMMMTTYSEVIDVAKQFGPWLLSSNVVDDILLSEIPTIELENKNIFQNSQTINNPTSDVFVLRGANVIVNINNYGKINVFCIDGNTTINVSNNSFCKLKSFNNSQINVYCDDNSICIAKISNASVLNFNGITNTTSNIEIDDNATANVITDNDSICFVRVNESSNLNYTQLNNSEIIIKSNQNSKIRNGTPV